jgi:hypothetical protein
LEAKRRASSPQPELDPWGRKSCRRKEEEQGENAKNLLAEGRWEGEIVKIPCTIGCEMGDLDFMCAYKAGYPLSTGYFPLPSKPLTKGETKGKRGRASNGFSCSCRRESTYVRLSPMILLFLGSICDASCEIGAIGVLLSQFAQF